MSKLWQAQSIQVYRAWHEAIMNEGEDKLTDWERKFIDSMDGILAANFTLTQSQAEKLEQIYVKVTKL